MCKQNNNSKGNYKVKRYKRSVHKLRKGERLKGRRWRMYGRS